jgi:hypothetical protein
MSITLRSSDSQGGGGLSQIQALTRHAFSLTSGELEQKLNSPGYRRQRLRYRLQQGLARVASLKMAEQQINLTDLEPSQLQEVKKQLDQVSSIMFRSRCA